MQPVERLRRHLLSFLILCLLSTFLVACLDDDDVSDEDSSGYAPVSGAPPTPRPARPDVSRDDQTWLVMIYSNADDEVLEEDMLIDINEAELVGSSERVTIVAQVDRYEGGYDGDGDWSTAKRFLIQQDFDLDHINSEELMDLGEVNMADGETLVDFVSWAAREYPADNYVLIMSDHGAGWPGGWNDSDSGGDGPHDIALAEEFGDMLFLMELGDALEKIIATTAIDQFELIGFDACLMSSIEVYTELAPYARYAVASQEVEPSLGWAYASFLAHLTDNPEIDGGQLAYAIVKSYIDQDQLIIDDAARKKYIERAYEFSGDAEEISAEEIAAEESKTITLTSVNLSEVPNVLNSLNKLAVLMADSEQKSVAAARRYAQAFETVFDEDQPKPYIDMGSFAQLLKRKAEDEKISAAVDELLASIQRAVIAEKHGSEKKGATGISIYFPNSKLYKDKVAGAKSYTTVSEAFALHSLWDDFLAFHYAKQPMPDLASVKPPVLPDLDAVAAPAAEPITIAPIQVSSDSFDPNNDETITLSTTIQGDNISYVYLFVGQIDHDDDTIRMIDVDFIDAEETKEVDGVFYPDWGSEPIDIEFEWDGWAFGISDGTDTHMAMLFPQDFGSSPESAIYSVDGIYTSAKSKKERWASLLFQDGELIQVLAYRDENASGSLSELKPKKGDTFTIYDDWIEDSSQLSETVSTFVTESETLTFGTANFTWEDVMVPSGDYLVGFIAEDYDGNWYVSHTTVTVE